MIRKSLLSIIIFVLFITLCACGKEDPGQSITTVSTSPSEPNATSETTSLVETEAPEEALAEYETKNHILHTFTDALVPFRFFMLSEDFVHQVSFVGDINQAVLTPRDKISRIDETDLGDLVTITITDTSGKAVTGTLSKENAEMFIKELQGE